jgi:regulatory protein YycH of two-component signal transduction system YycFG
MIDFLTIILLIFGVLQIILFFKVWRMTNDIKEIRNKYLKDEDEKRRQEAEHDPTPKISSGSKPTM